MCSSIFEKNMLALSQKEHSVSSKIISASFTEEMYRFSKARSGEIIPVLHTNGKDNPLHSTVDPRREGERLLSTLTEEGCLVFLGLGGGFAAEAALEREATKKIIILDYNYSGIRELLTQRDYTKLFTDQRVFLALDLSPLETETFILNNYLPALDGGICVFPLRVVVDADNRFQSAMQAVKHAIDAVSRDYSVQAYFGKQWFSNIIRNLPLAENQRTKMHPIKKAIICAAGPSLEDHIPEIKLIKEAEKNKEQRDGVLIATDTSLPVLLYADIEPDIVISIDCQHIGYQHFFNKLPEKTLLVLDLVSPPWIASRSTNHVFFSGGHPLSLYIRESWLPLPFLDTSGANVTYAALSLAEYLGAGEITLYGADFSYPLGKTYARGTYIYPFFDKKQSRLLPCEALHSVFLYRDVTLKKIQNEKNSWYYETGTLAFYRENAEKKINSITRLNNRAKFSSGKKTAEPYAEPNSSETICKKPLSVHDFLKAYHNSIKELSSFKDAPNSKEAPNRALVNTLLPLAAYFRRLHPSCKDEELFEAVKSSSLEKLTYLINQT